MNQEDKIKEIEKEFNKYIVNIHDVAGDEEPSKLFYYLMRHLYHSLLL